LPKVLQNMGRIKNALLGQQYEGQRKAEAHSEKKCIEMIGIINLKLDKLQLSVDSCNDLLHTLLQEKKQKKSNQFCWIMGGLTTSIFYYLLVKNS